MTPKIVFSPRSKNPSALVDETFNLEVVYFYIFNL